MKSRNGSPRATQPRIDGAEQPPDLSDIPETSFRGAPRNPYLVLLAPDVHALFPTADAVNRALREYARDRGMEAPRSLKVR